MKYKILFVAMMSTLLVLVCCSGTQERGGVVVTETDGLTYTKKVIVGKFVRDSETNKVLHFNYNGHSYIQFNMGAGQNGRSGIVHDPDCKCNRNQK